MSLLDHWSPRPFPTRWWAEWTHHSLAHLILLKPAVTMLSVGCLVSLRGQWFRALLSFLQFLLQKEVMVPLLRSTCAAALPSAALWVGCGHVHLPLALDLACCCLPSIWQRRYLQKYLLSGWNAFRYYVVVVKQICVCLKEGPTSVIGFVRHT